MAEVEDAVPSTETPTPTNQQEENDLPKEEDDDFDKSGASGRWTKEEDDALRLAVKTIGARNWRRIASEFLHDRRSDVQCLHRWQKVLRPGLVKGPWTPMEDDTIRLCMQNGITRWSEIAKRVPGRIGKQCRERWFNHLDPNIKRGEWTPEEDEKLIEGQALLGNKWSKIAKLFLPGRPENAVKNRWNAAHRRVRGGPLSGTALSNALNQTSRGHDDKTKLEDSDKKRKRKTGPRKSKDEKANIADGLEGMISLASLCADALDGSDTKRRKKSETKEEKKARKEAEKAAKKAEKKRKKEEEREAKKAAKKAAKDAMKLSKRKSKKRTMSNIEEEEKDASLRAAALLTAAAELQEGAARKKRRGSSFQASRPDISVPGTIVTGEAKSSADMTTPVWASAKASGISPTKSSMDGLHFLSSVVENRDGQKEKEGDKNDGKTNTEEKRIVEDKPAPETESKAQPEAEAEALPEQPVAQELVAA